MQNARNVIVIGMYAFSRRRWWRRIFNPTRSELLPCARTCPSNAEGNMHATQKMETVIRFTQICFGGFRDSGLADIVHLPRV